MIDLGAIVLIAALIAVPFNGAATVYYWRKQTKSPNFAYLSAVCGWITAEIAILFLLIEARFM